MQTCSNCMTYGANAKSAPVTVPRRLLSRIVTILIAVGILALSVVGERWLLVEAPPSGIEMGVAKGFATVLYAIGGR